MVLPLNFIFVNYLQIFDIQFWQVETSEPKETGRKLLNDP